MSASERPVRGHDSALPEAAPAYQHGLTKREYVAIQLAAGMLADESADPGSTYPPNGLAHRAVEFADALLAELAKLKEAK